MAAKKIRSSTCRRCSGDQGFCAASSREPPGKSQSGQVGEAVPVNLEGPERNGNGIDLGIAEHACDDPVNATRGRAKALRSDATQY
jgi:hypothetical protein